jgi:hypothetical protein
VNRHPAGHLAVAEDGRRWRLWRVDANDDEVPYSNDCVKDGYADPFDATGHGSGGLCAVQLDQLGWLAVRKIDVPGALGGPPLGQVV